MLKRYVDENYNSVIAELNKVSEEHTNTLLKAINTMIDKNSKSDREGEYL